MKLRSSIAAYTLCSVMATLPIHTYAQAGPPSQLDTNPEIFERVRAFSVDLPAGATPIDTSQGLPWLDENGENRIESRSGGSAVSCSTSGAFSSFASSALGELGLGELGEDLVVDLADELGLDNFVNGIADQGQEFLKGAAGNVVDSLAESEIGKQITNAGTQVLDKISDVGSEALGGVMGDLGSDVLGNLGSDLAGNLGGAIIGGLLGGSSSVPTSDSVLHSNTDSIRSSTESLKTEECLLDQIGAGMKDSLMKQVIGGMVGYINSGFSGGPAYLQDERAFLTEARDQLFEEFINNPANFSSLCSAWESDMRVTMATEYSNAFSVRRPNQLSGVGTGYRAYRGGPAYTCTLQGDGYADNDTNYWDNFLAQTNTVGGNPITSYLALTEQFQEELEYQTESDFRELARNRGFFDVTYCEEEAGSYSDAPGASFAVGNQTCFVTTPGSVVSDQLNNALGSDLRQIEAADEVDELTALMTQRLIQEIFNPSGLYNVNQKRSGQSQSFLDEFVNSTSEISVASTRGELNTQLAAYEKQMGNYIVLKNRSLQALASAKNELSNVQACYISKYNTVIELPAYRVVSPGSRLQSNQERATFTKHGVQANRVFLTPTQSGQKTNSYKAVEEEINKYALVVEYEISEAQREIEKVQAMRADLGETNKPDNPASMESLLSLYSDALKELKVFDMQDVIKQTNARERAVQVLLYGPTAQPGTQSGILHDFATCQSFSRIYRPPNIDEEESSRGGGEER